MLDPESMDAIIASRQKSAGMLGTLGSAALKGLKAPGQMLQKAAPTLKALGSSNELTTKAPGIVGGASRLAGKALTGVGTALENKTVAHGVTAGALGATGGYAMRSMKGNSNMSNGKYASLTREEQLAIIEQAYADAEQEKSASVAEVAAKAGKAVLNAVSAPGKAIQGAGQNMLYKANLAPRTAQYGAATKSIAQRAAGGAMSNKVVSHAALPMAAAGVVGGGYAATKKSSLSPEDKLAIIEQAYQDVALEKSASKGKVVAMGADGLINLGQKIPAGKRVAHTAKQVGAAVVNAVSKPGKAIQGAGANILYKANLAPRSARYGDATKSIAQRAAGKTLSNKYVAHGAAPVAVVAAGGGTALAMKKKKASDEAQFFAQGLVETNYYNALAGEAHEWKQANGLV